MACAESSRRRCLLDQLRCLVDGMDDCCSPCTPSPCGPSPCGPVQRCPPAGRCFPPPCPPGSCCPPIIEIYDPCPKPAIPLACPAPMTPLDPDIPVPHVACPTNPGGGVVIPIITPPAVPCIPLAGDCAAMEQPCVPCNPPAMMVCFRRGGCRPSRGGRGGGSAAIAYGGSNNSGCNTGTALRACKSRELRYSILKYGCDCIKRNGLQDSCPRWECQGRKWCLTDPPSCCPAQMDMMRLAEGEERYQRMYPPRGGYGGACGSQMSQSFGSGCGSYGGGSLKAEYLCYPAYYKMPSCSPNCCTPCSPFGGPSPCSPLAPPSTGPCKNVNECCPCPMPQGCPPVPTIPLPPCPPITIPSPPQVITQPIPNPVPTPIYPMCPCPPTNSPC